MRSKENSKHRQRLTKPKFSFMYRPIYKIVSIYVLFALLYYMIFSIIFLNTKAVGDNVLEKLLIAFGELFFWINVHSYFALTIVVTALIGTLISLRMKKMEYFFAFRNISIFSILTILTLWILSYL